MPSKKAEPFRLGEQMLTVAQVSDYLGVDITTVRSWIRSGQLVASHFGGAVGYRIERADLNRFIEARKGAAAIAHAREDRWLSRLMDREGERQAG